MEKQKEWVRQIKDTAEKTGCRRDIKRDKERDYEIEESATYLGVGYRS